MNKLKYVPVFFFMVFYSCKTAVKTSSIKKVEPAIYVEDVSQFRPVFESFKDEASDIPEIKEEALVNLKDDRDRLHTVRDSIFSWNKKIKYIQGYRIQVYNGRDRNEANKVKSAVYRLLPDADVYTEYKQPYFKTKVGNFFQRLEAQASMVALTREFPMILLVPDQIPVSELMP